MTNTRGARALYPCPMCLVPKEFLIHIWKVFELRTGQKALEVLALARQQRTEREREEILQQWGLRDVDVSATVMAARR